MPDAAPPPERRTTIYDIAAIAGVSAGAVSSILNGTWQKRRIGATTAERVATIARQQGYFVNRQASMLRRDRSHVIGMIVPKYDNRYFGAIAEQFEVLARQRGLFPVITCTQRDPDLEMEAARELVSYQADCLVVTGATDPDRIADFCASARVRTVNLDLPGSRAPSVISDNRAGARSLAALVLDRMKADFGEASSLWFVGGRSGDHNTAERLRGFADAHAAAGLAVEPGRVMVPGYASHKVAAALATAALAPPLGLFVNSTIALEGVIPAVERAVSAGHVRIGCFDWDPFAAMLPQVVGMARQDVSTMMTRLFAVIDGPDPGPAEPMLVPCILTTLGGRPSA